MADQNQQKEPLIQTSWISELVKPRPSNMTKIIAVWDGLSIESQIEILMQLRKMLPSNDGLQYELAKKVRVKALESKNAYIRYLAAKDLKYLDKDNENDKIIIKIIENDAVPFVRHWELEDGGLFKWGDKDLKDPAKFWGLPRETRLAKMGGLTGISSGIAEVLTFAVEGPLKEGLISEEEIEEIICEYVMRLRVENWFEHDNKSYDGAGEYFKGKDLDELWNVVPKLPLNPSYLLIKFLPTKGGLSWNILEEIVKQMSDIQLRFLLEREDVYLPELRKKIFFSEDKDKWLKRSAVYYNFDLTYEEFERLLSKPKKKKQNEDDDYEDELSILSWFANDLSLSIYAAIVSAMDSDKEHWDFEDKRRVNNMLEKRISKLEGQYRKEQQRELWLYYLACRVIENKGENLRGGTPDIGAKLLEFTKEYIVEGDIWKTFMNISETWENLAPCYRAEYDKMLARFFGDEPEETQEAKSDETQNKVEKTNGVKRDEMQNQLELVAPLTAELSRIKRLVEIVLYLLIGLAVLMFFRK